MPLLLPRFYAIIDRSILPRRALAELAGALLEAGVQLIQLRSKEAATQAFFDDARELVSLLAPAGAALIINDRADVAALAGAAGVHLGQDDLPVAAARAQLGPEKLIGFSTHTAEQLAAAGALPADYLAIGPIFATRTKLETEPVLGCARLSEARPRTKKPLVAIGGITPANAAEVIAAGADSVAVAADWLAAPDIRARLEEFRRALGRLD